MTLSSSEKKLTTDTIRAAKSSAFKRVYFLGPYARRVSFASQQNRALNLVWALHAQEVITLGDKVAVIGAGLSGVTAAAALDDLGFDVYLYEQAKEALHRQRSSSHRYIHPTVNLWPEEPLNPTTTFPYFDWICGQCDEMMSRLKTEWDEREKSDGINSDYRVEVTGFDEEDHVAVLTEGKNKFDRLRFDAVIVTSGFADEDLPKTGNFRPYWKDENLEDDVRDGKHERFLVSGCGDGGLIDALRIAHSDFNKGRLIIDVAEQLSDASWHGTAEIESAEKACWDSGDLKTLNRYGSEALRDVYRKQARNLPEEIADDLKKSLRMEAAGLVTMFSWEDTPFTPLSAPIHKLMIAHAMNHNVIKHQTGSVSKYEDDYLECHVATEKQQKLKELEKLPTKHFPGRVVVRHGAKPNFLSFLQHDEGAAKALEDAQRLLAVDLDKALWMEGENALLEWPPKPPFDPSLLQYRRRHGQEILAHVGNLSGHFYIDEMVGFKFEYRHQAKVRQKIAALPDALFGIPLMAATESKMPVEESTAYGLQPSEAGATAHRNNGIHRPGIPIASGSLNGRLGPIVEATDGRRYALSVKHVLFGASEGSVCEVVNEAGAIIGEAVANSKARRITEIGEIGLVQLSSVEPFSTAYGDFETIKMFDEDKDAELNKPIYNFDAEGRRREGRISATRTAVAIRMASPKNVVIRNAIRTRSVDKEEPFAVPGDSGSPVVDAEGHLVGLVISGNDDFVYLVPVDEFLELNELELAEPFADSPINPSPAHPFAENINRLAQANRAALMDEPIDLGEMPAELQELEPAGNDDEDE